MLEEQAGKTLSSAAKLCNSLLFSIRLYENSGLPANAGTKDYKDTAFQDLLLQLTFGQYQSAISVLKKLRGNPLSSDLLASLKHSTYTKANFAEIDFSKFNFGNPESPLKRKLRSTPKEAMSPGSIDRRTELSLQTHRDTLSDFDTDECFSIAE